MPREHIQHKHSRSKPIYASCSDAKLHSKYFFCSCTLLHYCCTPKPVLCWALLCKKKRGEKTSCKSVLSLSCATRWCSSKSMNGGIRAPMEQHLGLTSDPPSPPPPLPPPPPPYPLPPILPPFLSSSLSHQLKASRLIPFNLRHCSRSNASASTCPTSPCGRALRLSTCCYNLWLQVIRDVKESCRNARKTVTEPRCIFYDVIFVCTGWMRLIPHWAKLMQKGISL